MSNAQQSLLVIVTLHNSKGKSYCKDIDCFVVSQVISCLDKFTNDVNILSTYCTWPIECTSSLVPVTEITM